MRRKRRVKVVEQPANDPIITTYVVTPGIPIEIPVPQKVEVEVPVRKEEKKMAIIRQVASLVDMISSLDKIQPLEQELLPILKAKYENLLVMIERYVPQDETKNIIVRLGEFHDAGQYQAIANFEVLDKDKPFRHDAYNWHLQNTSQWIFAGGFLFDKQRKDFSIHT